MIRHLDLFAGIGGFSLAASWTGMVEPAGFCEIDPWCRRVLANHWPGVPQHDDIRTLTGDDLGLLGRIDLVTGGFPCQPFSVAGLRRGREDDRYLWPEMARVIRETRPTYVLAENSPRIIEMVLDEISGDLEREGYTVRAIGAGAGALEASHMRVRGWVLAYLDGDRQHEPEGRVSEEQRRPGDGVTPSPGIPDPDRSRRRSGLRDLQAGQSGAADGAPGRDLSDALCDRRGPQPSAVGRDTCDGAAPVGTSSLDRTQGGTPAGCPDADGERREEQRRRVACDAAHPAPEQPGGRSPESGVVRSLHGIPRGLDRAPGIGLIPYPDVDPLLPRDHGVPNRVARVRGLGNAIVPQVAYEILRVMLADELRGVA